MGADDDYDNESDDYQDFADRLNDEDKLSVELDDVQDNDSDAGSNDSTNAVGESTGSSTHSEGLTAAKLFAIGESKDQGLADVETGSEVYRSELLAGFDMEDFEDADEANEEDLIELGDPFAQVTLLVRHILDTLNEFIVSEKEAA